MLPFIDLFLASTIVYTRARVTGYDFASSCHNRRGSDCLTASGVPVAEDQAACPRYIPFGSLVVVGHKTYVCTDRYARWLDKKYPSTPTFDLFTSTCTSATCGLSFEPVTVWINPFAR